MSGIEVGALIVGIAGAAAGGISALKDTKESRSSNAVYKSSETTFVTKSFGNVLEYKQKFCATSGGGNAGIKNNGDMYASSGSEGSATALYSVERKAWK